MRDERFVRVLERLHDLLVVLEHVPDPLVGVDHVGIGSDFDGIGAGDESGRQVLVRRYAKLVEAAAQGNAGWGFDDVLPYFRKLEHNTRGANAWHGADGPQWASDIGAKHDGERRGATRQAGTYGETVAEPLGQRRHGRAGLLGYPVAVVAT